MNIIKLMSPQLKNFACLVNSKTAKIATLALFLCVSNLN